MKNFLLTQKVSRQVLLVYKATLVLLFCLGANLAYGFEWQTNNRIVQGRVTGQDNEPIPGVTVQVKEGNAAAISDADGQYRLEAGGNETIIFRFIGYTTQEVPVNGRTTVDVILQEDLQELDEVVVIGYGEQKKSHLTGAIAKVKNENLSQMPVNSVDQALVGKLAGVQISNTSADAGAPQTIQVRGIASINAGNDPLIVLDGFPAASSDLSLINMDDVESIEVLKDAASTAIYGSRGGNGVIMITTKSGQDGKMRINFNSYAGIKNLYNDPGIFPTPDRWSDYARDNMSSWGMTELPIEVREMENLGTATDWVDVMSRTGSIQKYNLSVSGGNEKVNYYISGNAQFDEGIFIRNDLSRYTFLAKVNARVNDYIQVGMSVNPTYTRQSDAPLSFHDAIRGAAWLPRWHTAETIQYAHAAGFPDVQVGDYAHESHFADVNGARLTTSMDYNKLASMENTNINKTYVNNIINSYAQINLLENLSFRTSLGATNRNYRRDYYRKRIAHRSEANEASYQNNNTLNLLSENLLNYYESFGDHTLNLLAGYSFQKWFNESAFMSAADFLTDDIETLNAAGTLRSGTTNKSEESLVSTLFRANYDFRDKYLVSLSARWDASSKFGNNNQWGFFPALSLGWRLSEEPFMQSVDAVNNLKLRATYGATGNNGIPNYRAIASLEPVNAILGNNSRTGFAQATLANPNLGWERTFEFNTGLDVGLFGNRIAFSMDYYRAITDQLLLNLEVPAVTGFKNVWRNVGKMENQGLELELTTQNVASSNFNWSTSFNISGNRNKLLDFGGVDEIISTPDSKRPSQFITRVGDPLVQYYGYVVDREIPEQNLTNPAWPLNVGHESIYVRDLDGDGRISANDRQILGNPYPDFIYGITNNFTYKNFDLNFVVQGSQGAEVFNIDPYYYQTHWFGGNTLEEGEREFTQTKIVTDDLVQDASFFALRNLQIGYRVPQLFKNMNAKIYLSGQNLLYITSEEYTSFNPEGINVFIDNPLTWGYQRGATPFAKTFALGINLEL